MRFGEMRLDVSGSKQARKSPLVRYDRLRKPRKSAEVLHAKKDRIGIRCTVLYREDLAYIHDARFGVIARSAAPVLLEALDRAGLEEGRVVDLGCGSGIFAEPIAAAGYHVLGVDVSRPMLSLARRRVPEATFRRGSLHSYLGSKTTSGR